MKKFMAIYGAPVAAYDEMMKNSSKEMQEQSMKEWMGWSEKHKGNIVDMGAPLGKNMRVTKDGASMMRNEIGGYTVVQADSAEEAAAVFADNPMFKMMGAYVDVLEMMPM